MSTKFVTSPQVESRPDDPSQKVKVSQDEKQGDAGVDLFSRCGQIELSASQLWLAENFADEKAELAWRSNALASAVHLAMGESELEIVSAERQDILENPSSVKEYTEIGMGVGAQRKFSSNNLSSQDIGPTSFRGQHSINEDFTIWLDTFGITALGVFDGHGGVEVSHLVADAFLRWLPVHWMQIMKCQHCSSREFWEEKLVLDFQCAQNLLRASDGKRMKNVIQSTTVGSTGIVVVADKLHGSVESGISAQVAWAGDSQLLHARKTNGEWKLQHITHTHDCENDDEWKAVVKQRNKSQPKVWCDSSDGKASTRHGFRGKVGVTRAFGDFDLVEHGIVLGAIPSIETLTLQAGDLLILGSDGLWDALDAERVITEMNAAAKVEPSACQLDVTRLSSDLASHAKTVWSAKGYQDDISVVAWCVPGLANEDSVDGFLGDSDIASAWLKGGSLGDRCQVLDAHAGLTRTQKSTCGRVSKSDLQTYDPNGIRLKCYNPDGTRPQVHKFGKCALPQWRPCLPEKFENGGCRKGLECIKAPDGSFCDLERDYNLILDELGLS